MESETKEENDEVNMDVHIEKDALGILKHMQLQQLHLSNKRRYLMGLSSREYSHQNARLNTGNQSALPESFLRKDDLFYDDVRILVERCFAGCNVETQQCVFPDDVQFFGLHNMSRSILASLDDLSNHGLYNVAKLLSGGLVTFVKTRPQMKRVIKSSLLAIQSNQYPSDYQVKFQNELSELLKSPKNFRQNYKKHVKLTLKSHHSDIMKVLNGLEDMTFLTLRAMYMKLKGKQRMNPQLHPRPYRKPKEVLIKLVKNISLDMIQQLGESDELQEPLVKAMAVAGLSLNVVSSFQDVSVPNFLCATPEVKTLQGEITKAIRLLDQRIRKKEMIQLRHLLDPDSTAEGRSLKSAIRNMLTEFLYECVDMDAVPDSLLAALSLINKRPMNNACRSLPKNLINDDVECILNVSTSLKQFLWECDPNIQLDQDFVDAYMEEAEESDDGDIFDDSDDDQKLCVNSMDESHIRLNDFSEEVGSTSCEDDACFISPSSTGQASFKSTEDFAASKSADDVCSDTEAKVEKLISTIAETGSSPFISSGSRDDHTTMSRQDSFKITTNISDTDDNLAKQNILCGYQRNQYVAVQEVCDSTSLVAFQLIGQILSNFGQVEALGLDRNEDSYLRGGNSKPEHFQDPVSNSMDKDLSGSIVVEAVHKVLPSFSQRELEMVKKLISL